jgi:hypothetical protein
MPDDMDPSFYDEILQDLATAFMDVTEEHDGNGDDEDVDVDAPNDGGTLLQTEQLEAKLQDIELKAAEAACSKRGGNWKEIIESAATDALNRPSAPNPSTRCYVPPDIATTDRLIDTYLLEEQHPDPPPHDPGNPGGASSSSGGAHLSSLDNPLDSPLGSPLDSLDSDVARSALSVLQKWKSGVVSTMTSLLWVDRQRQLPITERSVSLIEIKHTVATDDGHTGEPLETISRQLVFWDVPYMEARLLPTDVHGQGSLPYMLKKDRTNVTAWFDGSGGVASGITATVLITNIGIEMLRPKDHRERLPPSLARYFPLLDIIQDGSCGAIATAGESTFDSCVCTLTCKPHTRPGGPDVGLMYKCPICQLFWHSRCQTAVADKLQELCDIDIDGTVVGLAACQGLSAVSPKHRATALANILQTPMSSSSRSSSSSSSSSSTGASTSFARVNILVDEVINGMDLLCDWCCVICSHTDVFSVSSQNS